MNAVTTARHRVKEAGSDRALTIVSTGVMAVFALAILYPLIYVISSSFSSGAAISSGAVKLLPVDPNVDAYHQILDSSAFVSGFVNSLIYSISGALLGTALTVLAAYPLSRNDLDGRRIILFILLIPTLFSAGVIPTYMVVRDLHLLNTRWAIILPGAMSIFNVIITRAFYQVTIPEELLEASKLDGANDFQFLLRVALPLSKPILAVNLLFYAVAQWNGWFTALIYLTNEHLFPLQLVLRQILLQNQVTADQLGSDAAALVAQKELFDKLKYALLAVAMLPPLIAFPFVQKHFVRGALLGSLK
jgi:putative aldouronate transport system permease protein